MVTIPNDVMHSVSVSMNEHLGVCSCSICINFSLQEVAVPVLVPLIEAALIERMIAEAEFGEWTMEREDEFGDVVDREMLGKWLRSCLPERK